MGHGAINHQKVPTFETHPKAAQRGDLLRYASSDCSFSIGTNAALDGRRRITASFALGASPTIRISGQSAYPRELARFQAMLAAGNLHSIITLYPVRHSGILGAIAKALKFQSRSDDEATTVARISSDETLRDALLIKLVPLSTVINA